MGGQCLSKIISKFFTYGHTGIVQIKTVFRDDRKVPFLFNLQENKQYIKCLLLFKVPSFAANTLLSSVGQRAKHVL